MLVTVPFWVFFVISLSCFMASFYVVNHSGAIVFSYHLLRKKNTTRSLLFPPHKTIKFNTGQITDNSKVPPGTELSIKRKC